MEEMDANRLPPQVAMPTRTALKELVHICTSFEDVIQPADGFNENDIVKRFSDREFDSPYMMKVAAKITNPYITRLLILHYIDSTYLWTSDCVITKLSTYKARDHSQRHILTNQI